MNLQAAAHPRLASETSVCGAGHRKRTFQQLRASFFLRGIGRTLQRPGGALFFPARIGSAWITAAETALWPGQKCVEHKKSRQVPVGTCRLWHPRRESNSQLTLRRGLLYPFNYGGNYSPLPPGALFLIKRGHRCPHGGKSKGKRSTGLRFPYYKSFSV